MVHGSAGLSSQSFNIVGIASKNGRIAAFISAGLWEKLGSWDNCSHTFSLLISILSSGKKKL
jgi:hypothetical protein